MPAQQRGQGSSVALLERLVLAKFASATGLTRTELENLTGLSRNVVANVVASLVERGELVEEGQPRTTGGRGRPALHYRRAALVPPVLLVRLAADGSTGVSPVPADGAGGAAAGCAPWTADWPEWSRSVADAAERVSARAQARPRLVVLAVPFPAAEGESAPPTYPVPRPVLETTGMRLVARPAWLTGDPRDAVADLLGCTALMVSDAHLAALGEARYGAGRGRSAVVHVSTGGGIRAGFVLGGRLYTGGHGFSGELAHVQVDPAGYPCFCGSRGCLATETAPLTGTGPASQPAELGSLVGRALAPLLTVLDPDCVVADARLGHAAESFIAALRAQAAASCPRQLIERLVFVPGELDDAVRAGALAAADGYAVTMISRAARTAQSGPFLAN